MRHTSRHHSSRWTRCSASSKHCSSRCDATEDIPQLLIRHQAVTPLEEQSSPGNQYVLHLSTPNHTVPLTQIAETCQQSSALQSALQQVTAINQEAKHAVKCTPTAAAHLQALQGALDAATRALQPKRNEGREAQRQLQGLTEQVEAAEQEAASLQATVVALREQQVGPLGGKRPLVSKPRDITVVRRRQRRPCKISTLAV